LEISRVASGSSGNLPYITIPQLKWSAEYLFGGFLVRNSYPFFKLQNCFGVSDAAQLGKLMRFAIVIVAKTQ
jgi:hypothetical protein